MIVLFDCGSSDSMVKEDIVKDHKDEFFEKQEATYQTAAGSFTSNASIDLAISFDEFGGATKINHKFDIDSSPEGIGYDMIIGRDLLSKLNIDVRFSDKTIKWEDQLVHMKSFSDIWEGIHPTRKEMKATFLMSAEPKTTKEETERVTKILDATYEKANSEEVVANATSLNREQKRKILKLVKKN